MTYKKYPPGSDGGAGSEDAGYVTWTTETDILPNSRQIVDGEGSTVDLTTSGQVSINISMSDALLVNGSNQMLADANMGGQDIYNLANLLASSVQYNLDVTSGVPYVFGSKTFVIFHGVNDTGTLPLVTSVNSGLCYTVHTLAITTYGSNDISSSGGQSIIRVGAGPTNPMETVYRITSNETINLTAFYDSISAAGFWIVTATSLPKSAVKVLTPINTKAIVGLNLCDTSTGSFTVSLPSGSDAPGSFMIFRNLANIATVNTGRCTITGIDNNGDVFEEITAGHGVILMADKLIGSWWRVGDEGLSIRRLSTDNDVLGQGINILDAGAGNRTFILSEPGKNLGKALYIYREDQTANTVTINTTFSGAVVGAGANFPVLNGGTALTLVSAVAAVGTTYWYVLNQRDELRHQQRTKLLVADTIITADTNTINSGKRLVLDATAEDFTVTLPTAGVDINGLEFEMILINSNACDVTIEADTDTINGQAFYLFYEQYQCATFKIIEGKWYVFENYLPKNNTSMFIFGHESAVVSAVTRYLYPGSGVASITEIKLRVPRKMTLTSISVVSATAPGVSLTDTFTVRLNGVNTALTVALSGTNTEANLGGQSVAVAAGDLLSVSMVTDTASADADPMVTVEGY
jgi:hypothetical protein